MGTGVGKMAASGRLSGMTCMATRIRVLLCTTSHGWESLGTTTLEELTHTLLVQAQQRLLQWGDRIMAHGNSTKTKTQRGQTGRANIGCQTTTGIMKFQR